MRAVAEGLSPSAMIKPLLVSERASEKAPDSTNELHGGDVLPVQDAKQEAFPEAAAILRAAGWKPHDPWGVYTRGTVVMGFSPDGQHFDVKNWGADVHGPDYPDNPVEAAQWLVRRRANPLASEATLEPIAVAAASQGVAEDDPLAGVASEAVLSGENAEGGNVVPEVESDPDERSVYDADFTIEDLGSDDLLADDDFAPLALEGTDAEPDAPAQEDPASGAFIFGDNLHQMRTAAIGLVVQAAIERLPEGIDYARLAELRNFVMGVSEGRWIDDTAKRDELDLLETTERRRRAVETVRDEKVAFLIEARREEIEAFDPGEGWP